MENRNGNSDYNYYNGYYGYRGGAGQNPYGQYSYVNPQPQPRPEPKDPFLNREARHITKLSVLAGAAVLSFVGMQNIMSILLKVFGLSELYMSNFSFQMIFGILCSVLGIFVPFFIIYMFYSEGDKEKCFEFGKPVSAKTFLLAVPSGLMICLVSDYIASGFENFVSGFGVTFVDYEARVPANFSEFILFAVECAVVPALVEEFAVRGVIMQPLRRYGDRFAIVISSIIFAIMHGDMMQIPFALIAGFALGYFAISTGSIWTSVVIHFANNMLSVLLVTITSSNAITDIVTVLSMIGLIAVGIFSIILYVKTEHIGLGFTVAPRAEKLFLAVSSAVFIIVSYITACFEVSVPVIYPVSAGIFIVFMFIYREANKKALNKPALTGMSEKLMYSLYFATPTLLLAYHLLTVLTAETVSVGGLGNLLFRFALFMLFFAVSVLAVSVVYNSRVLENKKPYTVSLVVLAVAGMLTMIILLGLR